jgi:hypothetical protein
VPVQAKSVVTFKPGKEMEARVRQLDQEANSSEAGAATADERPLQAPLPPAAELPQ